jgi:hypothetical protein
MERVGKKTNVYSVWTGKDEGNRPPGKLRVDGKIIVKWIVSKYDGGGVDLINLAQERDKWRAAMKCSLTFGFHEMQYIS